MSTSGETTTLFSREELAAWARICRQEVLDTLVKRDSYYYEFDRHAQGLGPDGLPYELLRQHADPPLRAYGTRAPVVHVLMRFSPAAPLASVVHGCVSIETSAQMRALLAHNYGANFVDGGVLQVAERATPEDPHHFVSVTFLSVKPVAVVKARRYLMFEHSGSVRDADGELVVFKIARSIPTDGVPMEQIAPRSAKLVHGEVYVKVLLRAAHDGGRTDVTTQGLLNQGSHLPSWAALKLAVPLVDALARIGTSGVSRALAERLGALLRDPSGLRERCKTPSAPSPACRVCLRSNRRLLAAPTRVCVGCEREVCKACTQPLHFVAADEMRAVRLRFCRLCLQEAVAAGGQTVDAASSSSGSTASSHALDADDAR